jgi:hypothetical protein
VPAPTPSGWLNPGRLAGIPWLYALGCLVVLPVAVYAASYSPWIDLGNQWWTGVPVDHNGQTLLDLTISMYHYHDELRVPHAASSPWWAWPLDLKPVWFYQEGFANNTTGAIHDSGNLVVLWMAIPAVAFAAIAAWRRRSLSLTLIVLLFAAMWVPWTRIDRATFQYHVYGSLPFAVLALGYLLAELWHGPSRLAWAIARGAAALAILGAPLLWLFRQPLCALAGTAIVHPNGAACGEATRSTTLTEQAFVALLVLLVGAGVAAWQLWSASRSEPSGSASTIGRLVGVGPAGRLLVTVALTLAGVLAALTLASPEQSFRLEVSANQLALVGFVLLLGPALLVLRARDSRRLAVGIVGAAALFFLIWYPNLTGLPIPTGIVNAYLGLLPTWNYDFQFAVNTDEPVEGGLVDGMTLVVLAIGAIAIVVAMLGARYWGRLRFRTGDALPEAR